MFIWLCADTLSFYNSGIFLISIMWQIMSRPAGIDLGEIYLPRILSRTLSDCESSISVSYGGSVSTDERGTAGTSVQTRKSN
jgi:hypothetical protein